MLLKASAAMQANQSRLGLGEFDDSLGHLEKTANHSVRASIQAQRQWLLASRLERKALVHVSLSPTRRAGFSGRTPHSRQSDLDDLDDAFQRAEVRGVARE